MRLKLAGLGGRNDNAGGNMPFNAINIINMNVIIKSARAGLATLALAGAALAPAAAEDAPAENPTVTLAPGAPVLMLGAFDIESLGYSVEEFFVSGAAASYKMEGTPGRDGKWTAVPADTAPYVTRIVVARPSDPGKFNGAVLVEWLNVTTGVDLAADWAMAHREIMRGGYAYVGVSAQKAGIEESPQPTGLAGAAPLKKTNPERYNTLSHPGDSYSYDIYSQAGRLIKTDPGKLLGPLHPEHVLAMGESQSAARMVTYINAVDPVAKVYDGFLVHSRFGGAAPLQGEGMGNDEDGPQFVAFRSDLRAPVICVETETDILGLLRLPGYHGARVPDNAKLRVWELPGTAHADNYNFAVAAIDSGTLPIERLAAAWAPLENHAPPGGEPLEKPINNAPQHHYVVQGAIAKLDRWVRTDKAPAKAGPIAMNSTEDDAPPSFAEDANGVTVSGVRTPWVDAPIARTSGTGNAGNILASLAGSTEPFDSATLARLYPGGKSDYLKRFEASLDKTIKAGFILPADREEIMALAEAGYPDAP